MSASPQSRTALNNELVQYSTSSPSRVGLAIYAILVAGLFWSAYKKPAATFDRYLYAAVVAAQSTTDATAISRAATAQGDWGYVHWWFSEDLLHNPYHLAQQIPFYAIRPLYIIALRQLGLRLVSPLALVLISVVLLLWLRSVLWAGVVLLLPPLYEAAHTITPDALSAAFVLAGSLLLYRGKDAAGIGVLMCSVWVRTDSVLFVVPCIVWLLMQRRIRPSHAAALIALAIGSILVIGRFSGNYGWRLLLYHSFVQALPTPAEHPAYAGIGTYARALIHGFRGLAVVGATWALMGVAAWRLRPPIRPLLLVCIVFAILHLAVFPIMDERYLLPVFLISAIGLAESLPDLSRGLTAPA